MVSNAANGSGGVACLTMGLIGIVSRRGRVLLLGSLWGWLVIGVIFLGGAVLLALAVWPLPPPDMSDWNAGYEAGSDALERWPAGRVIAECHSLRARYPERRRTPEAGWWLGYEVGLCAWLGEGRE
jgi:hypothetical protein